MNAIVYSAKICRGNIPNPIVAQARTYIGTKYRHRGRTAKGLDCAGLPWLVYADLGVVLPDLKHYGREPHKDGLMTAVRAALGEPVWQGANPARSILETGDVVVLRFVREPHHMGIVGDDPIHGLSLIHSDGTPGVGKVVELGLMSQHLSQIVAVFRRPV